MSFKTRHDGAAGVREARAAIAEAIRGRQEAASPLADTPYAARLARLNEPAEQREEQAKAALAASTAARLDQEKALQTFRNLRADIAQRAAAAETERDQALEAFDVEAAVSSQQRVDGYNALLPALAYLVERRFSVRKF